MRIPSKVLDIVGTVCRLGLAAVWLISGAIKASDLSNMYTTIQAYQIFPSGVSSLIAAIVPFLELALGVLVLVGFGTRLLAVLSGLLLLVYIAGIAQSWARGLTIDCGCFGGGGSVAAGQTHYLTEILRDTGFIALAVWLLVRPRTLFALDGWFGKRQEALANDSFENSNDSARANKPSAVGRA